MHKSCRQDAHSGCFSHPLLDFLFSFVFCLRSNSDIWRDFPRIMIPLFKLAYLDNQQGSHTSVAGAVCEFEQLRLEPKSNLAYLQPYQQYWFSSLEKPIFPLFEMLGVFAGHLKARPRLPPHDDGFQAAQALWHAAVETTNAKWPEPTCHES